MALAHAPPPRLLEHERRMAALLAASRAAAATAEPAQPATLATVHAVLRAARLHVRLCKTEDMYANALTKVDNLHGYRSFIKVFFNL